jgi:hypothetical protein
MNALQDRAIHETARFRRNDEAPAPKARPALRLGRLLLGLSLGLLASGLSAAPVDAAPPDSAANAVGVSSSEAEANQRACLRCHAMPTLAYRNPEDGQIRDLSIDRDALGQSAHGDLACIDCHRRSYRRYPHPDRPAPGDLDCVGCHEDEDDQLSRGWVDIDKEFRLSVHAVSDAPEASGFSCHSCHDPHRFRTAAVGEPIVQIVRNHNDVCLSCHQELAAPLSKSHDWLPNRDAHWGSVRCVDCHTPAALYANHQVLPAEESAKNCVDCHSSDPELLARLYRFRSEEDIAERGLIAQAVFNEAYVVGMSKSPMLDRLSLAIIGLVVLLLTAHGVGRYLVHRSSRRSR